MAEEPERKPPKAPLGGRLAWWPFAAAFAGVAAIVVAIVAINAFAGGGTTGSRQQGTGLTASGAVACPEFFEHANQTWVPAGPAGVGARKQLVPTLHPTHVTVCQYARTTVRDSSVRLTGEHELSGKLDDVVTTLRAVPAAGKRRCNTPIAVAGRDYLIGLRYAEAIVWVSAPGLGCGSSNGRFTSDQDLAGVAAASFAARRWVASP